MTTLARPARAHARVSLAILAVLVALTFDLAPGHAGSAGAGGLRFQELRIPDPPGTRTPRTIRQVNPSLQRIQAWISSVGAGIALGDFDGNGHDDDLCD